MARKSVRLEIRLTQEMYAALQRYAKRTGHSMAQVVREAVGEYIAKGPSADRHALLERMTRLEAPAPDWDTVEREILSGRLSATFRPFDGPGPAPNMTSENPPFRC